MKPQTKHVITILIISHTPGTSLKRCGLILTNMPGCMAAVNPAMRLISSREAARRSVGRRDMEATTLRSRYPRYLMIEVQGGGVVQVYSVIWSLYENT